MLDDHARSGAHPIDEAIDEAERESFPASDPQSSWAGPDPVALASESATPATAGPSTNADSDGSSGPETTSAA
ncbi:MAG TPA: hypothetical protein VGG43_06345 [Acidimicrobiales bacterium]|jgi:hypothetical protein